MKKILPVIIVLLSIPALVQGIQISLGFQAGMRTFANSNIKHVYGNGLCYYPYAAINLFKVFTIGGGYDFGYSRDGKIGIYNEATTLELRGYEAFVGFQLPTSIVTPYIFAGYAIYSYKQTVDSPAAQRVDTTKKTFFAAAGFRLYPVKNIYLSAEVKYVLLKVKPYEDEVDLGGLRLMGGLGLSFGH